MGHDYDSKWGPVHLEQHGNEVFGTYECCGGGTITGVIRGESIHYQWSQGDGASGKGRWRILEGGDVLLGTWGTADSEWSGGDWNLYRRTAEGT